MALVNPSSLYSGAAQVFNNAPHLAFQARLLAQEQAKHDALDNYYRRLPLTINEKGVRDQEREPIANGMNAIKQYYIQNKDKLKNGDQAAEYNYEKMIREQQDLVGRSQNAGLTSMHVGKLKYSPNTAYMFQSPDVIKQLAAHELPVTDPNHVEFDMDTFVAPPKPYDRTTYFKNFSQLKGNDNKKIIPNGNGTETVVNTPTYEKPQKDFVLSVAADKYLHDPSFTKMVDTDLGAADVTNPLNADFKQHFGHDIQTPIDLATAYTFNGLKPQPITQKVQADQMDMMKRRQQFAKEQQARSLNAALQRQSIGFGHTDAKSDKEQKENNEWIGGYIDNAVNKSKNYPLIDGVRTIPLDPLSSKVFAKGQINPSALSISDDGKIFTAIYPTYDVNGNPTSEPNPSLSQPMDREAVKLNLGFKTLTKKELGNTMKASSTAPKAKTAKGLPVF